MNTDSTTIHACTINCHRLYLPCLAKSISQQNRKCSLVSLTDFAEHKQYIITDTVIYTKQEHKKLCYCRGTARGTCQILQLQNISLDLSCGIISVILRSVLIQYRNVTDTHRQTDRHTTTACTALSIASRGKNRPYCMAHQLGL